MLTTHNIPFQATLSIRELIKKDVNWYPVVLHIHTHLSQIKKIPRICDISFWHVIQNDAGIKVYCQEESGCEHKFIRNFPFTLPTKKFYLCLDELGGYTLMLPSDY